MKVSLNWIKEFVPLNIFRKKELENVVVGYVESMKKHPNADTLNVAQVNLGNQTVQIVCGGTNLRSQVFVPVAVPGAILPGNFEIKVSKIRGEESHGMICAKEELRLGTNGPREIWILDEAKKWQAGTPLLEALDLKKAYSPEEIQTLLTHHTAEVEGIIYQDQYLNKVVTGKLLEFQKIEGSDKLHKGIFDIGWKKIQIVFGSVHEVQIGEILPIALAGAKLPGGDIKTGEFLGVKSEGMVCGDDELGIGEKNLTRFPADTPLGKPVAEVLDLEDAIFIIDNKSLTHRPDLWGHYGIAREVAAITQQELQPFTSEIIYPDATANPLPIEIKAKKLCSRYIGIKIENINIEPSPRWMQNRLRAIGYRPINNIVDITNYVMAELGQPLHAFDTQKIEGGIIIRTAKKGEKITTLDGVTRELDSETLVIADLKKPIAIAGVMGGANSEIDQQTSSIIIESATFHASSVRKTSVRLGLRTEAVQRFEKSLDPHLAEIAMDRVCELIKHICPSAGIASPKIDIKNWKEKPVTVKLNLKKVYSKIGKEIPLEEVKRILTSLAFGVVQKSSTALNISIPSFRATKDIDMEDDLVEEIARMHGYEHIQPNIPELPIKLPLENHERKLKNQARQILSWGLGYDEVYNYSFYSLKDIQKSLLPEELHIKIQNYLSEDQTHLRVSLVPNILKNIAHNLKYYDEFTLYEIGRTYQDLQEYFPIEEKKICGVIVKKSAKGASQNSGVFSEAKGDLENFFEQMGISCFRMDKGQTFCPYAHPNRYAEYMVPEMCFGKEKPSAQALQNAAYVDDSLVFARVFELHPLVAKNYELQNVPIALFEINFTRLAQIRRQEIKYKPLPKFPAIEIDISVVIDEKTEIGGLQKLIKESDKNLIQKVELFDLYQGPNIPAGKKALAFKVKLQALDRTLTDEEMKKIQQNIFKHLMAVGGEIRGLS